MKATEQYFPVVMLVFQYFTKMVFFFSIFELGLYAVSKCICIGNHMVFSFNLGLICMSEFFKKLKLHLPKWLVQFELFEKFKKRIGGGGGILRISLSRSVIEKALLLFLTFLCLSCVYPPSPVRCNPRLTINLTVWYKLSLPFHRCQLLLTISCSEKEASMSFLQFPSAVLSFSALAHNLPSPLMKNKTNQSIYTVN